MNKLDQLLSEIEGRVKAATPLGDPCPNWIYGFAKGSNRLVWEIRQNHEAGLEQETKEYEFYHAAPTDIARLVKALRSALECMDAIVNTSPPTWTLEMERDGNRGVVAITKAEIEAALEGKAEAARRKI